MRLRHVQTSKLTLQNINRENAFAAGLKHDVYSTKNAFYELD